MNTLEVYIPIALPRVRQRPLAPRLAALAGKRIALLDNSKANAGELLQAVAAQLQRGGERFEIVTAAKNATAAAPDAVMAFLKTCDAVVLAIAD